jgi:DNA-binding FrmR family transcriptional regulator
MLSDDEKKKLTHRLSRVNGQVDAIRRMIDEDEYCVDILMQLSAATGALDRIGEIILDQHLKRCVRNAMENGDDPEREAKLEEIMTIFRKYR